MPQRKVQLLYDSINNNTGDRAVGEVMAKFISEHGGTPEILDPRKRHRLSAPVVVGGGELIHPPGDPFYDSFRLKGPHILNTAGITSHIGTEFLGEYEYVSVRSSADKEMIEAVRPDAVVAPCVATLLEPEDLPNPPDKNTILVHLHHNAAHFCRRVPKILDSIEEFQLRWISLTPYAGDMATMLRVSASMDKQIGFIETSTPQERLAAIIHSRLLICASLHGAIFAHAHNIPFLVFSRPVKVRAFLEDRDLERFGFASDIELEERLGSVLNEDVDFSATIEADRVRIESHLETLIELLGLSRVKRQIPVSKSKKQPSPEAAASLLERAEILQAYRELEDLAGHIKGYRATVDTLKREVDDLTFKLKESLQREEALTEQVGSLQEASRQSSREAEAIKEDRERWIERCLQAEARLAEVQREVDVLRSEVSALESIRHELVEISNTLRLAQATRVSERLIRYGKRLFRTGLKRLDPDVRRRVSAALERVAGRPLAVESSPRIDTMTSTQPERASATQPHLERGTSVSDAASASRARAESLSALNIFPDTAHDISVLIPTYNAGPEFGAVLRSLASQRGLGSLELIVVDSGSSDGTPELAESFGATVHQIPKDDFNHGATRNFLAELAKFPYLLFCTQDAMLAGRDSLRSMAVMLESEPRIAACSARQIPRTDADLYGSFTGFYHSRVLGLTRHLIYPDDGVSFEDADPATRRRWCVIDNVMALYRRQAWEELRFNSSDFAEDLDFAYRALLAGWKVGYCHSAAVAHSHDRPALYHFKRHIMDRLFVADIIGDSAANSTGSLSVADYAAAGEAILSSLDERLATFYDVSCSAVLSLLRDWSDEPAARSVELAESYSRGNEHNLELSEISELVGFLDLLREEAMPKPEAVEQILSPFSQFLDSDYLSEFAYANPACGRTNAVVFAVRLVSGTLGSVVGEALRSLKTENGIWKSLITGV